MAVLARILAAGSLVGLCGVLAVGSAAQDYPNKPIRAVIPFPPGTPQDFILRLIRDRLQAGLKQPLIVENRPGATGNIGVEIVAKAPPDGYTILATVDSVVTINPHVFKKLPFNPATDLVPVIYRTASGRAVALEDRCPHRGAPLSAGEVHGETLSCGYHGFTFDPSGQCVHVPGMASIPRQACVKSYPVLERWGWIFAWLGDAALVDEAKLPDFRWMTESGHAGGSEHLAVKANYTLVRDNLLDLTHARYVHKNTLATNAVTEYPISIEVDERRVRVVREMPGIEASPFFKRVAGHITRVDHRQRIDFFPPCYVLINTTVASVAGSSEQIASSWFVLNALTPENAGATHYFWGLVRNIALEDDALTETQQSLNRATFHEDLLILEQQQQLLDCAPANWRPIATPNDGGCVQAERLMNRLLEAERSGLLRSAIRGSRRPEGAASALDDLGST